MGVKLQTIPSASHFTDSLPFSEASPHSTEIITSLFYEKVYPTICHIKKSHDINISHKSCSDGVNKKLPSEISVKPDLTKDLKENRTHTHTKTNRHTHKETHRENRPYVNPIDHYSCCFHSIF